MITTARRTVRLIGAGVVAAALLAGCGSDGGSADTQSAAAPAEQARDQGAPLAGAAPAAPAEGGNQPAQAPDLSVDQRSIIYTGSLTVRVPDVDAAAAKAGGIATGAGGFIGDDQRHSGSGADNASLTLRVPAEKFSAVVTQLADLGVEQSRSISTEDVTEQTIDLDARIAVQQARVDSGRKLLAEADSLNDLVMLEREVATRESDLASLQAKKRRLADLTALSTITVVLLDPEAEVAEDDDRPGFLAGLTGGWHALMASLGVLLTVLGALLPWLIALGLPALAVFWAVRRITRRRTQPPVAQHAAAAPHSAPVPQPAFATAGAAPHPEPDPGTRPDAGRDSSAEDQRPD